MNHPAKPFPISPAGERHGRVAMGLARLLANHVEANQLGIVCAAATGFVPARNPDTVRAPDAALVATARLAQITDSTGFVPFAPDLAAEVVSPSGTFSEVESKALDWLQAGCRLVLLVDPETRTIHTYRSETRFEVSLEGQHVDASDAVEGWQFAVDDVLGHENR
jgi:Uma2 family endonuclease